jgi:hypothetical protein
VPGGNKGIGLEISRGDKKQRMRRRTELNTLQPIFAARVYALESRELVCCLRESKTLDLCSVRKLTRRRRRRIVQVPIVQWLREARLRLAHRRPRTIGFMSGRCALRQRQCIHFARKCGILSRRSAAGSGPLVARHRQVHAPCEDETGNGHERRTAKQAHRCGVLGYQGACRTRLA